MRAMFDLFWNLCLLRIGPERMPTAGLFVALVVGFAIGSSVVTLTTGATDYGVAQATTIAVVAAAVLAAATFGLLQLKGVAGRFTATFTALMGADAVLTLLAWPIGIALPAETEAPMTPVQWLLVVAYLALTVWRVVVFGFVYARALEIRLGQGVAVSVLVALVSLLVLGPLIPPAAAT